MNSSANSRMFVRVAPNTYNPIMGGFILLQDHKPYGPYKEIIFMDKRDQYPATFAAGQMTMSQAVKPEAAPAKQIEIPQELKRHPSLDGEYTASVQGELSDKATVTFFNARGNITKPARYTVKELNELAGRLNDDFSGIGEFSVKDGKIYINNRAIEDLTCTVDLS